ALSPLFTAARRASALAAAFFWASRNLFQSLQITGLVAYFPSGLVAPVPGGNTSGIFLIDWVRPAALVSACARSALPSVYALMLPRSFPWPFISASRFFTTASLSCAGAAAPKLAKATASTAASAECRVDDFIRPPCLSTLGSFPDSGSIPPADGDATSPVSPHHYVIGISICVRK